MGEEEIESLLQKAREQVNVDEELKEKLRKSLGICDQTQTEGEG